MPKRHSNHSIREQILGDWPVLQWKNVHVGLAVSGGADSMALLRAMLAIKAEFGGLGKLHVIHVDHQLRQDESEADAQWRSEEHTSELQSH